MNSPLPHYRSRAARALILLHERELRRFIRVWREARDGGLGLTGGIPLPESDDPDYASPDLILTHVLATARAALYWLTGNLGLPDPEVDRVPEDIRNEEILDLYVEHLVSCWASPLAGKSDDELYEYLTPIKPCYASAMLEHAVMHPMRHSFQLEELMGKI